MMSPFNDYLDKTNSYSFNNSWQINAPLERIWNELVNYKNWPEWCNGLEKIEPVNQFEHLQTGNHLRSVWKGYLPYSICFDAIIDEIIPYSSLTFIVSGDLNGQGNLRILPCDNRTMVTFVWNVAPTKLWMRMSSPFARSYFVDNHDQIVEQAICGFTRMIEQEACSSSPTT